MSLIWEIFHEIILLRKIFHFLLTFEVTPQFYYRIITAIPCQESFLLMSFGMPLFSLCDILCAYALTSHFGWGGQKTFPVSAFPNILRIWKKCVFFSPRKLGVFISSFLSFGGLKWRIRGGHFKRNWGKFLIENIRTQGKLWLCDKFESWINRPRQVINKFTCCKYCTFENSKTQQVSTETFLFVKRLFCTQNNRQ